MTTGGALPSQWVRLDETDLSVDSLLLCSLSSCVNWREGGLWSSFKQAKQQNNGEAALSVDLFSFPSVFPSSLFSWARSTAMMQARGIFGSGFISYLVFLRHSISQSMMFSACPDYGASAIPLFIFQ